MSLALIISHNFISNSFPPFIIDNLYLKVKSRQPLALLPSTFIVHVPHNVLLNLSLFSLNHNRDIQYEF